MQDEYIVGILNILDKCIRRNCKYTRCVYLYIHSNILDECIWCLLHF